LGNGSSGVSGPVSASNSLVGTSADAGLQPPVVIDTVNGNFFARFLTDTGGGGGGRVRVGALGQPPTATVPAPQTAYEALDKAIHGITVADPDGGHLTVALAVSHGKLTLGTTAGLSVSGNGTGKVTLSGSIADLNTALLGLLYRGSLNYSGADTLSITVSDGSLSASGSVAITVKSAAQQAAALQAQVAALRDTGV